MKRYNNLFDKIVNIDNLYLAEKILRYKELLVYARRFSKRKP